MIDALEIKIDPGSTRGIESLMSQLDLLKSKLNDLGNSNSTTKLEQAMAQMSAAINTGFAGLSQVIEDRFARIQGTSKKTADQIAADAEAADARIRESQEKTGAAIAASIAKRAEFEYTVNQKRVTQGLESDEKIRASQEALGEDISLLISKRAEYEYTIDQKRIADAEKVLVAQIAMGESLSADIAKRAEYEYTVTQARVDAALAADAKILASQVAMGEAWSASIAKRAEYEYTIEQKRIADAETESAKLLAIQEAQDNRQRALNTAYRTATLEQQAALAQKATVYAGLGGDATAKFGASAASADLTALQAQIAAVEAMRNAQVGLKPAIAAATVEQTIQNDVLTASQGLFRGAAHEAGMYGLVHGQILALLAGAGLAAALHQIAVAGAEVEYNLKFLQSLSSAPEALDMDKFINITSGTISNIKEAAEGMRALAEAGFTQQQALTALPDLLQLSALGEMKVAEAAKMAVESMHAFGMESTDLGQIGDILVTVAAKTNVSVKTLSTDMAAAATTIQMFGGNMQEAAGMVGVLAQRGLTIQPLASAMTSLYEPTAKVQKVLDQIKFSAKNLDGSLKDPIIALTELKSKLDGFSNPVDILTAMFPVRSAKAIQAITQDMDKLKDVIKAADDAGGKMFQATMSQADTVEGQFKIIASTLSGDFQSAFEAASPVIRQVETELLSIMNSQGVKDFLSQMAVAVARLTELIITHRSEVLALIEAYAGFKILSSIIGSLGTYRAAQEAANAATIAAAAARAALTAEQRAALVTEESLNLAATAGSRTLSGAASALGGLSKALGAIGIVISLAAVAYEVWNSTVSKGEETHLKVGNTIAAITQAYEKQNEALRSLADQYALTGKTGEASVAAVARAQAEAERSTIQGQLNAAREMIKDNKPTGVNMSGDPIYPHEDSSEVLSFATAQEKVLSLRLKMAKSAVDALDTAKEQNALLTLETEQTKTLVSLQERAAKLPALAKTAVGPEAPRLQLAAEGADSLAHNKSMVETEEQRSTLLKDIEAIEKQIGETKTAYAATDAKATKDWLKAQEEIVANLLKRQDLESKIASEQVKSRVATGAEGIFQGIEEQRTIAVQKALNERAAAQADYNLIVQAAQRSGDKNTEAARTEFDQKMKTADAQAAKASEDAGVAIATQMQKIRTQADKDQIADALAKHNYLLAGELQFGTKYKAEVSGFEKDIANLQKLDPAKVIGTSPDGTKVTVAMVLAVTQLGKASAEAAKDQQALSDVWKQGAYNFEQAKSKFDDLANSLSKGMSSLVDQSAGLGLAAQWDAATAAETLYQKSIGDLNIALQKLKDAQASKQNDPKVTDQLQIKVTDAQAKVQSLGDQMKKIWAESGAALTSELTAAFGNAGTAVGGLIQAYQSYGSAQEKIDKDVAAARLANKDSDPAKKAQIEEDYAKKSASVQIKTYADMASAAQGFFAAGTKGYEAMGSISKIYHAVELAMTVKDIAMKLFGQTAVTDAVISNADIQMGIGETQTAATVINDELNFTAAVPAAVATAGAQTGWIGAIAMLALMASLGFAGGGGASVPSSADNQKTAGTGTVMGDSTAKSTSIDDSIKNLSANSNIANKYSEGMLNALNIIKDNIGALSNAISMSPNLAMTPETQASYNSTSTSFLLDPHLFSSTTTLTGEGLQFGSKQTSTSPGSVDENNVYRGGETLGTLVPQTVGQIKAFGLAVQNFVDTTTTASGLFSFFGSSGPNPTQNSATDPKITQALTSVILGSASAVSIGGQALGVKKTDAESLIDQTPFNVGNALGKLDFTGLSASDRTSEINAVLSSFSDAMAEKVLPSVKDFERAGEGGFAAMSRLVVGTETARNALDLLGVKMIDYHDIVNKQGDVQTELERQSIMIAETRGGKADTHVVAGPDGLLGMSSGTLTELGKVISTLNMSGPDMATAYQVLSNLNKTMVTFGVTADRVDAGMIAGAGDYQTLAAGMTTYYSKFKTAGQQATSQGLLLADQFAHFGTAAGSLNEVFPTTRQGFTDMVDGALTGANANSVLAGQLMATAGAADSYYSTIEAQEKSFKDSMATLRGVQPSDTAESTFNASLQALQGTGDKALPWITSYNQLMTMSAEDYSHLTAAQQESVNLVLANKLALDAENSARSQASQSYAMSVAKYNGADQATLNNMAVANAMAKLNEDSKTLGWTFTYVSEAATLSNEQLHNMSAQQISDAQAVVDAANTARTATAGALDPWAQNQANAQSGPTALDTLLAETKKFIEDLANIGETSYENAIRTIKDNAATRLDALNKAGTSVALTSEQQAIIQDANRLYSAGQITAQQYADEMAKAQMATVSNTQAIDDWTQAQINLLNAQNKIKAAAITDPLNTQIDQTGMSQLAISIQNINKQADDYLKSLKDLGQTTAENTTQVELWRKTMVGLAEAKGATDTMTTLLQQIDQLASMQKSLKDNQNSIAVDGGANPADFTKQGLAAAQAAFDQINNDSTATLAQKMTAANDLQTAIMANYNAQKSAIQANGAKQDQVNQQVIQDFNSIQASLRKITDYASSLLTSADSTLTPLEQLNAAQSKYQTTLTGAQGGDQKSLDNLQNDTQTYLDLARGYYASNEDYVRIFTGVQSTLATLGATAKADRVPADETAANTAAMAAALVPFANSATGQLSTLAMLTSAWQAQQQAQFAAQALVFVSIGLNTLQTAQALQGLDTRIAAIIANAMGQSTSTQDFGASQGKDVGLNKYMALVTGYKGAFVNGGFATFMAAHPEFSMPDMIKQYSSMSSPGSGDGAGPAGYGGIPSLDVGTNYLPHDMLIKAHKGEAVIPPADNARLFARLASPEQNSAALVSEIRALRAENAQTKEALVKALAAQTKRASELAALTAQAGDNSVKTQTAALKAAGKSFSSGGGQGKSRR